MTTPVETPYENEAPTAPLVESTPRQPVTQRPRRTHPSHGARVIALMTSVGATIGVGAALAYADSATATANVSAAASATATPTPATPSSPAAGSTAATATAPAATSPAGATTAMYANGTYTGAPEWTKWGNYQVQVVVQGGKIVSVKETQAPTDPHSTNINNRAQLVLESEAVAAQSANINAVSGATYTSKTYKASLQSALDLAAKAAQSVPAASA